MTERQLESSSLERKGISPFWVDRPPSFLFLINEEGQVLRSIPVFSGVELQVGQHGQ